MAYSTLFVMVKNRSKYNKKRKKLKRSTDFILYSVLYCISVFCMVYFVR